MCQDTGPEARCPAHEFVRGEGADGLVRAVAVVVPQPVAHGDGDVVVVMEPPPVGELSAEAGVIAFDDPVLPGRAGVDGERADATVGQAVADDSSDKLGPVVGADVLGGAVGFDGLREDCHDVVSADTPGDVVGDALLRVLVDEHQGPEASSPGRDVRHEVRGPHMAGVGGLSGDATGGVAAAWPPQLLLRDAEAEQAPQPADLPEADRRQPLGRQEPVNQDLGLTIA